MNNLTTFQRKLVYAGGILVLLVPIIALGRPATRTGDGGKLAEMRRAYDLGETSLGNVDPSSSTMNLVLLGFRGVATYALWDAALDQRDQKQWAQLRATTDSILLLQPHYIKVWDFQGWNLAYNVSAEWDNVPDRYYWVKEGGKFYMRGVDRNARNPDLPFRTGELIGNKIGRADEWAFFRNYFLDDPDDDTFGEGKPDPAFNRGFDDGSFTDNYLAARDWFLEANDRELKFPPQHRMMRELFRSYPAHQYMEMGNALHRDGKFGEPTRQVWTDGFAAWTGEYGREEFPSEFGPVRMEVTSREELEELARENSELLGRTVTAAQIARYLEYLQNTANYRYWRLRSQAESETNAAEAHREIYEGQQRFKELKEDEARAKLVSGLEKLETLFAKFPGFEDDDLAVEEVLMAQLYLRATYQLKGDEMPEAMPLQRIWDAHKDDATTMDTLQRQFKTQTRYSPASG